VDAVPAVTVTDAEWGVGSAAYGWTNEFAGSIDEVAIYNKALSPTSISTHYSAAVSAPVTLTIALSSGVVTVSWSSGTLQEASTANGPWSDLTATSPYQPPATSAAMFYRVKG
jgi:hypothetical protein